MTRENRILLLLAALVLLTFLAALRLGSLNLSTLEVWQGLWNDQHDQHFTVWNNRLPRALLAIAVGAAAALAGAIVQGVILNPLAAPDTLSLNHGASLGAVLTLMFWPGAPLWALPLVAFVGAAVAFTVLMLVCGRRAGILQTALIGVALSALYAALVDYLMLSRGMEINTAMVWLTGSLWGRSWPFVQIALPFIILLLPLALLAANSLDLLSLGRDKAASLGLNVPRQRLLLLGLAVLLAAAAVAVAGPLSFLGLVAPHLARQLVGGRHRLLLPATMLTGALILQLSDIAVRIIKPPLELPAGIFTALLGAPYFFYLLKRRDR